MRRLAALALAAPALTAQAEPVLVPDVSQRSVEIRASFTGAELLLFGAILYPGGRQPGRVPDVVVTLRGPTQSVRVREKARMAGIWINARAARFRSVPVYYAVASSRPVSDIVDERTASIYELGVANLQLSPIGGGPAEQTRFASGLIDLRRRSGLFAEEPGAVEITDGVLYRARLDIPARVPVGTYTAETLLIDRGRVVAAATRDVTIRKSGFERLVAAAAQSHPWVYGALAVALSLALGWVAGAVFRRR